MKTIKYILSVIVLLAVIWSCEDNNLNDVDFLSAITAPENVTAQLGVTQDNTGLVTITPNSDGASSYNIYFGDDQTEPDTIAQGESVQHTYAEGSFNVRIVAIGLGGKTTEVTVPLEVSFEAPSNLEVTVENDAAISKQVNVTATADDAISFEVDFGDGSELVEANIGEVASHVYADAGVYTITVTAMSAAIETVTYTEADFDVTAILQPISAAPTPKYRDAGDVISIFSGAYTNVADTNYFPDWGQAGQGSGWAMFDFSGDEMLQYVNLSYQGIALADDTSIDVSGMEYLHLDVWTADVVTDIEVSLINNAAGTTTEAPVTSSLTANNWTSIEIPISDYTDQGLTVTEIFQLKLVGTPWAAGTVFVDNIYFYKSSTQTGAPIVFDDFEGEGNITTWFGDNCGMDNAFANPFKNTSNDSDTVLEYNDAGGQYANVRFDNSTNFDLTEGNSVFTLKIYVPSSSISGSQPNQISLKLQDGTANEPWALQTEIVKPLVLDQWQEISFDFANDVTAGQADPISRTDFNRVVLQVNSENNTDTVIAYIDDVSYGNTGSADTAPFATDDFEGDGTITTWYGDAAGMDNSFANPFNDVNNSSATVLEYNDTGGQYANIRFDVTPNFDLNTKAKFTLKIYVPSSSISGSQPNQISLKLQDGTANEPWALQTEIVKPLVLDQWQEISFDFANDVTAGQADPISRTDFNRVVLQVNSENNTDTVIAYIDDFNYHN